MPVESMRDLAELALTRWAEQRRESDAMRDSLVLGALAYGISKHRVHILTGLARTTIDTIVQSEAPRT